MTELILELGENNLSEQEAKYIGQTVGQMTNLEKLTINLYMNFIKDEGCRIICENVAKLTKLRELFLKFCYG